MSDTPEDLSKTPSKTPSDNLNPWEINLQKIENTEERKHAEQRIVQWGKELQQKLDTLMTSNGIKIYVLGFVHDGTKETMNIVRGGVYNDIKVTKFTWLRLKDELDKDVAIE